MIYQSNETMKLLSYQTIEEVTTEEYQKQMDDILAANAKGNKLDINGVLMDAYMLGIIRGIRKEREKRK